MKRAIITLALFLTGIGLFAQSYDINRLYATYRGEDGVVAFTIPGFLCRFAAAVGDLDHEEEILLRSIRSVKILVVENPEINRRVNFVDEIRHVKPESGYHTLLRVSEEDEDVLILGKKKKGCLRDLVIIVGGEENVIVSLRGRMNTDLLYALSGVTGIEACEYTKEL